MLKENKKTLIITSIVTLLPIVVGLLYWNRLPDVMATHFGGDNTANGFTGKAFTVFGLPLILLGVHWLAAFVTASDPRRQNITPKLFSLVLWLIPLISVVSCTMVYFYNLGYPADISFIAMLLVSVILIVIGNYLPKARHNYTIGIKIAWTLANEENWNRTHRLAGYLWMAGGVVLLALTLLRAMDVALMGIITAVMVAVPIGYSWWLHAKCGL